MKVTCANKNNNLSANAGLDSLYPYLTNYSAILISDIYGFVTDYTNGVTIFRFFDGNTEVDLASYTLILTNSSYITLTQTHEGIGKGIVLQITDTSPAFITESVLIQFTYNSIIYYTQYTVTRISKGTISSYLAQNDLIIYSSPSNTVTKTITANKLLNDGDVLRFTINLFSPYMGIAYDNNISFILSSPTHDTLTIIDTIPFLLGLSAGDTYYDCVVELKRITSSTGTMSVIIKQCATGYGLLPNETYYYCYLKNNIVSLDFTSSMTFTYGADAGLGDANLQARGCQIEVLHNLNNTIIP